MSQQPEPRVDPRSIPVQAPENDEQPYLIYAGVDGMPMHLQGKYYFAPRSFDITRGRFCDHYESPELATIAAVSWASRFQNPNQMKW